MVQCSMPWSATTAARVHSRSSHAHKAKGQATRQQSVGPKGCPCSLSNHTVFAGAAAWLGSLLHSKIHRLLVLPWHTVTADTKQPGGLFAGSTPPNKPLLHTLWAETVTHLQHGVPLHHHATPTLQLARQPCNALSTPRRPVNPLEPQKPVLV